MPFTPAHLAKLLAPLSPETPAKLRRRLRAWTSAGAPRLAAVAIELARHSYSASDHRMRIASAPQPVVYEPRDRT